MNWQIIWRPEAIDQMSDLVRAFPERKADFAGALRYMAAALAAGPEGEGESRDPPFRVLLLGPLTVRFRPWADELIVYITSVRLRGVR